MPALNAVNILAKKNKQRWVKETSSETLSHLYDALGERLALYTEHYRLPALIALYKDLVKKHPGDFDAVIDAIRQLDNPENDVARAEQYITTLRQKAEAQWNDLEARLNTYHQQSSGKPFEKTADNSSTELYEEFQAELEKIAQERGQLLEEKHQKQLTQEESTDIREKQIALSIREAKCQLDILQTTVHDNWYNCKLPKELEDKIDIHKELREYYSSNIRAIEKMQFFCETKKPF